MPRAAQLPEEEVLQLTLRGETATSGARIPLISGVLILAAADTKFHNVGRLMGDKRGVCS